MYVPSESSEVTLLTALDWLRFTLLIGGDGKGVTKSKRAAFAYSWLVWKSLVAVSPT